MKIVLATGIYPPAIGGPATYVRAFAEQLHAAGHAVTVVTYGAKDEGRRMKDEGKNNQEGWRVVFVPRSGGPVLRWWRYAQVLKKVAADAAVVEAFSSVSAGVPIFLARLRGPKKVLRLGGDFFWERYTDRGGMKGLKEWYALRPRSKGVIQRILSTFDAVVFSTEYQKAIYRAEYRLPMHVVIENALPAGSPVLHAAHMPFRLLFLGRFVGFKNLPCLLRALTFLPQCTLTFVGDGPLATALRALAVELKIIDRVTFLPSQSRAAKQRTLAEADLLVLPSLTELSPNVALEARAAGLPVLLTRTTGFGEAIARGMVLRDLKTPEQTASAIADIRSRYASVAQTAAERVPARGWESVTREHLQLFHSL